MKKILALSGLSLLLMQVSCGNKDVAEDVNIKPEWEDGNVLHPGSSLSVKGDVEGNKPYTVSFALTNDDSGKTLTDDQHTLWVTHKNPKSGKTSLSLSEDMEPRVNAGLNVCNGKYTLHIIAKTGQADVKKPLHFTVEGGRDASLCKTKTDQPNTAFKAGKISNRWGPDHSAFNLVEGHSETLSSSDAKKDLQDVTLKANAHAFKRTFGSNNGSLFVQTRGIADNASDTEIQTAFNNGAQTSETGVLNAGDVVIVKVPRDNNSLYMIKIMSARADEAPAKPGRHQKGAIRFEFRKVSSVNNT